MNGRKWTKRKILSEIAKLFDPSGWLSPCIILAKMFMQTLWLLPLEWDSELPEKISSEWLRIRDQFSTTCSVKIPRWIGLKKEITHLSLQGFSDASEKAYACVVYLRVEYLDSSVTCNLIAAITKVAPVKRVTLPRLELNASVLMANLMTKIKGALKIDGIQEYADFTIVLCWLSDHSDRWKTYVGNRVSEIQGILLSSNWDHVESNKNPADCASRGVEQKQLESFDLWWHGPDFLKIDKNLWPKFDYSRFSTQMEERKQ